MAARYALASFWFHNSVTGRDEYVHMGALRDTTHQAVVSEAAMFTSVQLDVPNLDPRLKEYLRVHPGGPGE